MDEPYLVFEYEYMTGRVYFAYTRAHNKGRLFDSMQL